mmetsp:Transcript_62437/g.176088  ORF Transcript_62437/g.176088 Transcript_62437/m.176088 type:complete len:245 (-) Transcript_62437:257-991(-)
MHFSEPSCRGKSSRTAFTHPLPPLAAWWLLLPSIEPGFAGESEAESLGEATMPALSRTSCSDALQQQYSSSAAPPRGSCARGAGCCLLCSSASASVKLLSWKHSAARASSNSPLESSIMCGGSTACDICACMVGKTGEPPEIVEPQSSTEAVLSTMNSSSESPPPPRSFSGERFGDDGRLVCASAPEASAWTSSSYSMPSALTYTANVSRTPGVFLTRAAMVSEIVVGPNQSPGSFCVSGRDEM